MQSQNTETDPQAAANSASTKSIVDIQTIYQIEREVLADIEPHAEYISKLISGMGSMLGGDDEEDREARDSVVEYIMFVYRSAGAHFVKHFREKLLEKLNGKYDGASWSGGAYVQGILDSGTDD